MIHTTGSDDWRRLEVGTFVVLDGVIHAVECNALALELDGGEILSIAISPVQSTPSDLTAQRALLGTRQRIDVAATAIGWTVSPAVLLALKDRAQPSS